MNILSHAKVSALSTAVLSMWLLLGGFAPAYGQTTVRHDPSVTQQTPPSQTVSSATSDPAQSPEAKAHAQPTHTSHATHHRAVRHHRVARMHHYPKGPSGKVNMALRADPSMNGSQARAAESGGIVLYGTVFDEPQRLEAERIAMHTRGVKYVINDLKTTTGQWMAEQVRINAGLLQVPALQDVSARVIGPEVYLSGQVNSEADKDRAARMVSDFTHLEVVNTVRVVPPSIFSIAWWS